MTILEAIILGLVEGITEYLPVSSTGHLLIAAGLLGLTAPAQKDSVDTFTIVIQGGAILAVLGLYWPRVTSMLRGIAGRDANGRRLLLNLIVAFIPAAVLGLLLDDYIEALLMRPWPVMAALFIGGVWMLWLDRRWKARAAALGDAPWTGPTVDTLTWKQALAIGFMQCVAMWPGTSRSMMTIAGGQMLGLRPKDAAEFSFLLGLPTLGAACLYKLTKNMYESHKSGAPNMFDQLGVLPCLVGIAVATVSAVLAVKWLVGYLSRRGLGVFGVYRIALALLLGALVLGGIVRIEPEAPVEADAPAELTP